MAKVYQFMADGFEDIEALAPVDILRRGGVDVQTVSINGKDWVESAHGVAVRTDLVFTSPDDYSDADLLMLPGGMPGAQNLCDHVLLGELLIRHFASGKRIGAICAAPMVLGKLEILQSKRATCYPGFEEKMIGAVPTGQLVEEDGLIVTGEGPAAALPYAYRLLALLTSDENAYTVAKQMRYTHLMGQD